MTLSQEEVDEISRKCLLTFNGLPKCGKPVDNEWTVLSCVVLRDRDSAKVEVVSLGTGSKCVGASKMSPQGAIVNDSHAEVFARRSFLLYIYDNIQRAMDHKVSIFHTVNNKFKLNKNIEFIFYSSQMPCGDASIIPMSMDEDHLGHLIESKKHKANSDDLEEDCYGKQAKFMSDVYRTGAKCIDETKQDPLGDGTDYHVTGVVRTKPGRGDRTLSMSCSDKMARWVHCGIQGSLLDLILEQPIHIKYFIFGSGVPFSKETVVRALLSRNKIDCNEVKPFVVPEIYQTTVTFPFVKSENNCRPAPGSILWNSSTPFETEVAVQGKKLGLTKKAQNCPNKSLSISKYNLYKKFLETINKNSELCKSIACDISLDAIPYNKMKKTSKKYFENWTKVKENFFKAWTVKPDMWDFCIKIS